MKKYIVSADTYNDGYGIDVTLFGIFDTKEQALQWIMTNPVQTVKTVYSDGSTFEFDFFKYYNIDKRHRESRGKNMDESMEQYATRTYIREFDGSPIELGAYYE